MGQHDVDLDLDEVWPSAQDLVALQFRSDEEFVRCRAFLWKQGDCYRTVNKWDRIVVVKKADLPLFEQAGLTYTEVELIEPDENPTEDVRAQQREMMKRYMKLWLQELGWDKT
jgi:hypothetical protein